MKPIHALQMGFIVGAAFSLSGCGNEPPSLRRSLEGAARAVALGRAADDSDAALRAENPQDFVDAQRELHRLGGLTDSRAAQVLVAQATQFDTQSQSLSAARREQERQRAASLYRQALQLDPKFDSSDPTLLNALGYFLAERGQTPQDFQQAERLTRRAVAILDRNINDSSLGSLFVQADKANRAITRDSVAWALFRQGRFDQARLEQEAALKEYEAIQGRDHLDPELLYHLGEIYRALQRPDDARRQYQAALKLQPDHALSQRALKTLP